MKKYEIVMKRAEIYYKERAKIKEGCTMDCQEPETITSFETLEEAKEELKKYQTSIRELSNHGMMYFLIEEYMVVENEYDEDGEWMAGGDVWAITPMQEQDEL